MPIFIAFGLTQLEIELGSTIEYHRYGESRTSPQATPILQVRKCGHNFCSGLANLVFVAD